MQSNQSSGQFVQALESRTLLSAVGLSSHGVLYVEGNAHGGNYVTIDLTADGNSVQVKINGHTATFAKGSVHGIVVDGGDGADQLTVSDDNGVLSMPTYLFGHAGADTIIAGNSNVLASGGLGNDTITVGNGNDSLFGGAGDDHITAGNGADFVFGGLGNDSVTVGNGGDTLFGLAGNDTIVSGSGADFVGAANADHVDAGGGQNTIWEVSGSHVVVHNTGGGTDTIVTKSQAQLDGLRHWFIAKIGGLTSAQLGDIG